MERFLFWWIISRRDAFYVTTLQMSMNGIAPVNLEVASTALNDGTWHELAVTQIGKVGSGRVSRDLDVACYSLLIR